MLSQVTVGVLKYVRQGLLTIVLAEVVGVAAGVANLSLIGTLPY